MTYKEMLNRCKECPGWIKTSHQVKADTAVRNVKWEQRIGEYIRKQKETDKQ
jgi:hypothetical protein